MVQLSDRDESTGRTSPLAANLDHDEINVPRSLPEDEAPTSILRADANRLRRG
jgi:hypothetical protein